MQSIQNGDKLAKVSFLIDSNTTRITSKDGSWIPKITIRQGYEATKCGDRTFCIDNSRYSHTSLGMPNEGILLNSRIIICRDNKEDIEKAVKYATELIEKRIAVNIEATKHRLEQLIKASESPFAIDYREMV